MSEHIYDLIIVGAGPAGLTAGLYAGRATLDTLILEGNSVGGQVTTTSVVYNYPGVAEVDGTELMNKMQKQVADFGVKIKHAEVTKYDHLNDDVKTVIDANGQQYQARSIIISGGANPKKVGFPGEEKFRGRGVAYCSTCDGELFTGLQIFVVGGGYAAAEEADYLSRYGKHVTVLVRGDQFTCPPLIASRALDNPKVSVEYNTEVESVEGDDYLTAATLINNKTGKKTVYHLDDGDQIFGIFVYVGTQPATQSLKGIIRLNEHGYIITDDHRQTNIPGVFAAGDIIEKELRQIVTATADGAEAATAAEKYVTEQKQRLRIPIHFNAKEPAKTVGQTSSLEHQEEVTPHVGNWLTADIVQQLQPIFARLTRNVSLQILTNETPLSAQLVDFVTEFATLDGHLNVEIKAAQHAKLLPQLRLLDDTGKDTGLHYVGIPTGHELNSLVLGVYNVAGPGQTISPEMTNRIKKLPAANIEIGVSLTCHFCPDVVAACQQMAALNPNITATMIDLQHFPELRKAKNIMSVPATMINDGPVIFGSQTMEQLVKAVEEA
ncbi:FAD-dependent oxidoreductase [Limosilactobacillus fastidiosus]|uniref:FAD-dependent oxidoreductase n=1 Tax=Limosilactobacillus fastidiosus TaxID=2759855 RepID=A0A7W3U087_9LACO|nr:FAD-dependent oxidoreductase [Limosilactobacillus fastidiosus]MBB1086255.1 FAD-dependent oxidoreductase [Limosilactobacillus fastidiosus]MCD7086455.1 FAD-dependent oxidoreductase [Limosilactobacillus fastidiosus]MCD7114475.1 FAD-dependent oxidoreductase [Limosilactobacillus fastidiosus]MCD7116482.1 FAD-dependent oxidoreductase [Limosilactobacillus fastidiosus]